MKYCKRFWPETFYGGFFSAFHLASINVYDVSCVDSYLWILSTWKGTVLHTQSDATLPHIELHQPLPFLYNLSLIHPWILISSSEMEGSWKREEGYRELQWCCIALHSLETTVCNKEIILHSSPKTRFFQVFGWCPAHAAPHQYSSTTTPPKKLLSCLLFTFGGFRKGFSATKLSIRHRLSHK